MCKNLLLTLFLSLHMQVVKEQRPCKVLNIAVGIVRVKKELEKA